MTAAELTSFNAPLYDDTDPPAPSGIPSIITAIGTAIGAVIHHPSYPALPTGVSYIPRPAQPAPQQAGFAGESLMLFLILGVILFMLVSKKKG